MKTFDIPVRQVTCLEDRAVVTREGKVAVEQGRQALRLEGVSSVAVDRSLSVSATGASGAQVVSARILREWKLPPLTPQTELQQRVDDARQALSAKDAEMDRLRARLKIEQEAPTEVLRAMAEQSAVNEGSQEAWRQGLAQAREAVSRTEEALLQADREHDELTERLDELSTALLTERPAPVLATAIELTLDAPQAGELTLQVRYLTACAAWRPAYRARLFDVEGKSRLHLEAEAVVWQATGECWADVALELSTERPTLGTAPPTLTEDFLQSREKSGEEKKRVEVALREQTIQTAGEGQAEMMGVDDGGEVRVLRVQGAATVPDDGRPHRLPLFSFETDAQAEVMAAPEKSPLASLVARFDNAGPSVLLAGPVELSRQSGHVGRGQLAFAAKGEPVKLSFGSEDRLRVSRSATQDVTESKLTGRRTTKRTVKVWLSNLSDVPANLVVEERIPVSEIGDVQVEWVKKEATPPTSIDKDGIVRYQLALEGLAKHELTLVYEVSAAARVQGL